MDGDSNILSKVQGKTLADTLAECKNTEDRLRLLPQYASLCDAVGVAHSRGVIHRGLNPGVVLLTDFGETVVSDWSLSKVRGRTDHQRDHFSKSVAGAATAAYFAPEILRGGLDEVDARSDVYALGAILYTILAGKPPLRSEGKTPESLETAAPDTPRELMHICRRAMFEEASARHANAAQLAEDVRGFDADAASTPSSPQQAGVDPLYKTFLGAAVVALLVFAAGFGLLYRSLASDRAEAVRIRDREIENRQAAEEARDKLAADLQGMESARARSESDREIIEEELARARAELEAARTALNAAKEAATTHSEAKPETLAQPPDATDTGAVKPAVPGAVPAPAPVTVPAPTRVEPFSTPLPALPLAPALTPAPAPVPAAPTLEPAPAALPLVPPAGTPDRNDFAKAMPDLVACLAAEKVEGAESEAVLRISDATPAPIKAMGFKDGDIVTRINRNPVQTVEQAKRALANVRNDSGFSIRIMRNGRAGWMRINFTDTPPTPAEQAEQTEAAQQAADQPANQLAEEPADQPADQPAEEPADQPADEAADQPADGLEPEEVAQP